MRKVLVSFQGPTIKKLRYGYVLHEILFSCWFFASMPSSSRFLSLQDMRAVSRDPIQTLNDCKDSVTSLIVTPSEIVASSVDGRIRTYDLRNGRLVTDHIMRTSKMIRSFYVFTNIKFLNNLA
jgi:hypothetical protein